MKNQFTGATSIGQQNESDFTVCVKSENSGFSKEQILRISNLNEK